MASRSAWGRWGLLADRRDYGQIPAAATFAASSWAMAALGDCIRRMTCLREAALTPAASEHAEIPRRGSQPYRPPPRLLRRSSSHDIATLSIHGAAGTPPWGGGSAPRKIGRFWRRGGVPWWL